jgi:hypothetical protein
MTNEEKVNKMIKDFSSLNEEKQDYILGILQALTFAKDEIVNGQPDEVDINKHEGVLK